MTTGSTTAAPHCFLFQCVCFMTEMYMALTIKFTIKLDYELNMRFSDSVFGFYCSYYRSSVTSLKHKKIQFQILKMASFITSIDRQADNFTQTPNPTETRLVVTKEEI